MIRACFLTIALLLPAQTIAQSTPVEMTRAAQQKLEQASLTFQNARRSDNRVIALTQAVRSYEAGLLALREGVQTSKRREDDIRAIFDIKQEKLSKLVVILQSMARDPVPNVLLHPSGPTNTTRAAMMVEHVANQIDVETADLKAQLAELAEISTLDGPVVESLTTALSEIEMARAELTSEIANRIALPRSFTPDPVRIRNLMRSSETLDQFVTQLAAVDIGLSQPETEFSELKGQMESPATGALLTAFNVPDDAGQSRSGLVIAPPPEAIVITPTEATVRYAGPLFDHGPTVILQPSPDVLLILAGLDQLYAEAGQVLASGTPIGIMGGSAPAADSFLSIKADDSGGNGQETLYIEIRNGDTALDPQAWFALQKE